MFLSANYLKINTFLVKGTWADVRQNIYCPMLLVNATVNDYMQVMGDNGDMSNKGKPWLSWSENEIRPCYFQATVMVYTIL